ncbi:MAG: ABC transporter ATP-binding protein/permease, partial [Actinomycetota bacterium]|nr:ABC transporter ATP-binding protein/permease [Actinomycetota bacterium]
AETAPPVSRPERLRALVFVISATFRADPWRALLSCLLVPVMGLAAAATGLWLKLLVDGITSKRPSLALAAVGALAATTALGHVLKVVLGKVRFRLQEATSLRLERRLVELAASLPGLEHHERPEFLDRVEHLRAQRGSVSQVVAAMLMTGQVLAAAIGTAILLVSIHPGLLLLPLLGLPSLATSARSAGILDATGRRTAQHSRLASHYLKLATALGPAKELRLFGLGDEIRERQQDLLGSVGRAEVKAATRCVAWDAVGTLVFLFGYLAAIAFVLRHVQIGLATPGDIFLLLELADQVSGQVTGVAQTTGWLQRVLLVAGHFLWLEDHAKASRRSRPDRPTRPAPERLRHGIALNGVSFRYPGTEREVLHDVSLLFPAGSVVALVGENGAGKSTLVKLLCGFYTPTSGSVTVDGVGLTELDPSDWRERTSGAFQDFCRFEFTARQTVGIGDLPAVDDERRVTRAVDRAGASEIIAALPEELGSQLGRTFSGVDLSEGQWQKLALARARMRLRPLLYLLDEPTSALDPASEHALFSRITSAARETASNGAITVLVSHRLSTVQDADIIVVLDEGRVIEVGSHAHLMAERRLYSELFTLQARAYQ